MSENSKRALKYAAASGLMLGALGLVFGGHIGISAAGTAVAGTYIVAVSLATIGVLGGALIAKST